MISVPATLEQSDQAYFEKIQQAYQLSPLELKFVRLKKKSLDARKKSQIVYHYQAELTLPPEREQELSEAYHLPLETPRTQPNPYEHLSQKNLRPRYLPVIIGTGPAGSFTALTLAEYGVPSVLVERGEPVEARIRTVSALRRRGVFNPESHYCYGEGGAGTFSDGKLTCGRNHPLVQLIFNQYVRFGAPKEIQYHAHPHMGTDHLLRISKNMRQALQQWGCEFLFRRQFVGFRSGVRSRYEVLLSDGEVLPTDHLILAMGHSARDTYAHLLDCELAMAPKPFAMGARIEHPQDLINQIQFGQCSLPAAEYKLTAQAKDRGIWTFCMCPGGFLMPTGAEPGHLAINGMSYFSRASGYANAAVVVGVRREDFYQGHPLDGAAFQRAFEKQAFAAGGGGYAAPAQRLTDFLRGRASQGELRSTYRPGVNPARMDRLLPSFVVESLRKALKDYDQKMRGYVSDQALIVGLESKTSSPVVMLRDRQLESVSHPGIYPAGEGAGFAGGIVSAALDGVKVAQSVLQSLELKETRRAP